LLQTVVSLSKNGPKAAMALGFGTIVLYVLVQVLSGTEFLEVTQEQLTRETTGYLLTIDNLIGFVFLGFFAYSVGLFCMILGGLVVRMPASTSQVIRREYEIFETGNGLLIQRYQSLYLQFEFLSGLVAATLIISCATGAADLAGILEETNPSPITPGWPGIALIIFVTVATGLVWLSSARAILEIDELLAEQKSDCSDMKRDL
jgi:hypothetical protein